MSLSIRRAKARAEELEDALEVGDTWDVTGTERAFNFKKRWNELVARAPKGMRRHYELLGARIVEKSPTFKRLVVPKAGRDASWTRRKKMAPQSLAGQSQRCKFATLQEPCTARHCEEKGLKGRRTWMRKGANLQLFSLEAVEPRGFPMKSIRDLSARVQTRTASANLLRCKPDLRFRR